MRGLVVSCILLVDHWDAPLTRVYAPFDSSLHWQPKICFRWCFAQLCFQFITPEQVYLLQQNINCFHSRFWLVFCADIFFALWPVWCTCMWFCIDIIHRLICFSCVVSPSQIFVEFVWQQTCPGPRHTVWQNSLKIFRHLFPPTNLRLSLIQGQMFIKHCFLTGFTTLVQPRASLVYLFTGFHVPEQTKAEKHTNDGFAAVGLFLMVWEFHQIKDFSTIQPAFANRQVLLLSTPKNTLVWQISTSKNFLTSAQNTKISTWTQRTPSCVGPMIRIEYRLLGSDPRGNSARCPHPPTNHHKLLIRSCSPSLELDSSLQYPPVCSRVLGRATH